MSPLSNEAISISASRQQAVLHALPLSLHSHRTSGRLTFSHSRNHERLRFVFSFSDRMKVQSCEAVQCPGDNSQITQETAVNGNLNFSSLSSRALIALSLPKIVTTHQNRNCTVSMVLYCAVLCCTVLYCAHLAELHYPALDGAPPLPGGLVPHAPLDPAPALHPGLMTSNCLQAEGNYK